MSNFNLTSDESFFQRQSAIFISSYSDFEFSHHHSPHYHHLSYCI